MKHNFAPLISLVIGAALLPQTSQAQLRITEVQSSEKGSGKPDWFELTNVGNNPVDITGYAMDDNSRSFALSVGLLGVTTINSGESVVFFESSANFVASDYKAWWWGVSPSPIQVGSYSGSGVSLSDQGDEVNVYTSTGLLVDGVSFGVATKGVTFAWDGTKSPSMFLGPSSEGVNGAFKVSNGDIGSPGISIVPEPSVFGLFGLALGGYFLRQALKKRN